MNTSVKELLGVEGAVARSLNGYEFRPQQLKMAEAVEEAIRRSRHLVVEAGTGTGKSLAYLTPFVLWTVAAKKRVLVATHTKALQQQLVDKDLPFLQRSTGIPFRYVLCVGTQNYLCRRRLEKAEDLGGLDFDSQYEQLEAIRAWARGTGSGLVFHLPFQPPPQVWAAVNRQADSCLGTKCPRYGDCFYFAARRRQREAHVLVANHHLFFANMTTGWHVLPEVAAVVFDEAQTLEEVAGEYLGLGVSNTQVEYYLNSLYNARTGKGLLATFKHSVWASEAVNTVAKARQAMEGLFLALQQHLEGDSGLVRFRRPPAVDGGPFLTVMNELTGRLKDLQAHVDSEEEEAEVKACVGRGGELSAGMTAFLDHSLAEHVYWLERSGTRRLEAKAVPIDLAPRLRTELFDHLTPIVLTSATLSVAGSFTFFRSRVGLQEADELAVGSPFDFRRQVLIYLAEGMPDPSREYRAFHAAAVVRAAEICRLSDGRAFVLFTSHRALLQAKEYFAEHVRPLAVLCQGDHPLPRLLAEFKRDKTSVLLGTNTFWEGIDVPGEALQCVVVTKLPFAVPDHPLMEARTERISEEGGNPFFEYQVPKAVIQLRQGFGRLIRATTDYGVFALLDPRVRTKRYGQLFLHSLPECEMTGELTRIGSFLAHWRRREPEPSSATLE